MVASVRCARPVVSHDAVLTFAGQVVGAGLVSPLGMAQTQLVNAPPSVASNWELTTPLMVLAAKRLTCGARATELNGTWTLTVAGRYPLMPAPGVTVTPMVSRYKPGWRPFCPASV